MEELLASSKHHIRSYTKGEKVKAKFLRISGTAAFFDIGGKGEGLVADAYFSEAKKLISTLSPGEEISATVVEPETRDGVTLLSLKNAAQKDFWEKLEKSYKNDESIDVVVKFVNPHGLVVRIDTETAFIPSSQLGSHISGKGEDLIDEHLKVKIIDLDFSNSRIVLSERAVSESEEIEKANQALEQIKEGDTFVGKVTTVTQFGAFVEIKVPVGKSAVPVEGLVHISELSWSKPARAETLVSPGDTLEVTVLGTERGKLSLSAKNASDDPWEKVEEKFKVEDRVSGKVVRVSDFGIFVELEDGVEGLVHLTKIPPGVSYSVGQSIDCTVEQVDKKERRISLGVSITAAKPVGYK